MPPPSLAKTCQICHCAFLPHRPSQKFCSNQCSANSRSKAFYRAMGKKGGSLSGERKKQALKAALAGKIGHLPPVEAFLEGARWQTRRLTNGIARRKKTEGFQQGWDACLEAYGLCNSPRERQRRLASLPPTPTKSPTATCWASLLSAAPLAGSGGPTPDMPDAPPTGSTASSTARERD